MADMVFFRYVYEELAETVGEIENLSFHSEQQISRAFTRERFRHIRTPI